MATRTDMAGAILAIDLGSTWLKAAWITPDGRQGQVARIESPIRTSPSSAYGPKAIWDSVLAIIATQLESAEAPEHIHALALTGVTRTHVFLDEAGDQIGPMLLWDDPYGEDRAADIAMAFGEPETTIGYGAFHPLARLAQFERDWGQAPAVMIELKDWLNARLTGRLATDAVAYGRIQPSTPDRSGVAVLLDRLGFAATVIPSPTNPDTILGTVQPGNGAPLNKLVGVPVAASSFDTWCSTLGMGAIKNGGIYDISGTTEVMGTFGHQPRDVPGMVCLPWATGLWHVGGPCQTGLGTLAWFARTFLDRDDPAATLEAAKAATTQSPPLCIPYLSGERMPWWNSQLSASFEAVRAHHTRNDFAQAVVEGLALAHRLALDKIGALNPAAVVHMGGGGTRHPYWCQMRADAFGVPVATGGNTESALAGAALAASVALGYYRDLQTAQQAIRQHHSLVLPNADRANYFRDRATVFSRTLDKSLTP